MIEHTSAPLYNSIHSAVDRRTVHWLTHSNFLTQYLICTKMEATIAYATRVVVVGKILETLWHPQLQTGRAKNYA